MYIMCARDVKLGREYSEIMLFSLIQYNVTVVYACNELNDVKSAALQNV